MGFEAVRSTVLLVAWMLVLILGGVAGGGVLPNCTTSGTTLPTADTTVNMSCTSVVFSNVVVTGSMMLNISIAGILAANPSSLSIPVTISNMTLRSGAILAIDSRGYVSGGREVTVSIMIQSLIGNDGCIVFLGSFPPRTTILVSGAVMTSSTGAAPTLPTLDPIWGSSWSKIVALVNVSLTSNSSMIFANCSLSSSSSIGLFQFFTTGAVPLTFSNGSILLFQNCTMWAGYGYTVYMSSPSPVFFTRASYLALSSCNVTAAGGGSAIFIASATFTNSSYLALSSCTMTGQFFAFDVNAMTVDGWSYVVVTNSSFTGTSDNRYPPVSLSWNNPLVIGNSSWVLWKGNRMTSLANYTSCIGNDINFSSTSATPGTFSILDNSCTCGSGCSMWTASVSLGLGGRIYQRCNTVNDVAAGSALLPAGAISAGGCGSCNASADCFWPLTVSNSSCNINVSTGKAVCQCLLGGVASNMCLPPSLIYPSTLVAAWKRTVTVSPSSEIMSASLSTPSTSGSISRVSLPVSSSASLSRTVESATRPLSSASLTGSSVSLSPATRSTSDRFPSVAKTTDGKMKSSTVSASQSLSSRSTRIRSISVTVESETGFWSDSRIASTSLSLSSVSVSRMTASRSERFPSVVLTPETREGEMTLWHSRSLMAATATTSATASPLHQVPSHSPTAVMSPSILPSTFVCELDPKVVLRNTTSLSFSTRGTSSLPPPVEGSTNGTSLPPPFTGGSSQPSAAEGGGGVVTVAAGGTVPMASVLAAAGLTLHVDFVATVGYSFAELGKMSTSLGNIVRGAVLHSTNISVDVSIANLQMSELPASSVTHFVVSVDVVVSPPLGTLCPSRNVTLVFECFFSPLRTSAELKSAVDTTYRTSTALSSVLGNPVTAMSNTGMVSILTLEECVFSDIDPLDASVSPIPWAVGDEVGQYYRGCVVVAAAANVGYYSLALLCALVIPKLMRGRTPGNVLGLLRYPSSVMIFVGMFHQGMVSSSVSLLRLSNSPLDVVLGTYGLVAATCMTVFMLLAGTRWRQCHVADRSEDETRSLMKVVQVFLDLALWRQHWVDDLTDGAPSGYKRRYFFILDDMAVGYWTAVELMSGLAQGAVLGVRKNDLSACQIQRVVLVVHCFLMVSASLIIRPCGSLLGNLFLVISKVGSFLVSLLIVIHTLSGSEEAHRESQLATAGFAFVSSVQTVIQLLLLFVLSRKTLLTLCRSLLLRRPWAAQPEDADGEHARMLDDFIADDCPSDFDLEEGGADGCTGQGPQKS